MAALVLGVVALFLTSGTASAQRLPGSVVPSRYELTIDVDLPSATFRGQETIQVEIRQPGPTVTLNAAEIAFESVTIAANGKEQKASVTADAAAEQATFRVESPLAAGPATIRIAYKGTLNDQLRGLYLSRANNRRYAVSQLEATDARRMFPCFDEPAMKAEFTLTAIIDAKDHAISNGAIVSDTPGPRAGTHTVRFETTPRMSTYLVALAVGDFVCRQGGADGTPIRVCTTPDKQRLTGFALEAAEKNLRFYNTYYTVKYPFKKLDIVAVPDFSAGAMENTAAIFYRETLLLADPEQATDGSRRLIAQVLAHEMAHQWFGNLVTMQWWDDLWLNEGFANWMETKPLKAWNSSWHSELDEVVAKQEAMRIDALGSTRPIRAKAETPAEINELFDAIAYNKGAAVLRMIEGYVGAEPFRAGVNAYLEEFKYANARAEDFWTVMTRATGKPVDRVMSGFVDQPGVPLLSLALRCASENSNLGLSQARYLQLTQAASASTTWDIPACVRMPDRSARCEPLASASGTMSLAACPDWVMGNADGLGYYRVEYSPDMVRAMAGHLSSITPAERLSLLSDARALVFAGKHDISVELDLAAGFSGERQDVVVGALVDALAEIDTRFTTDASRPKYRQWVRQLLNPAFREVGWTASPGDTTQRKALRANLVGALGGIARDPDVLARARTLVEQMMKDPASVHPELRSTVVDLAALGGDSALYDKYLAASKAAKTPDEMYRYLNGLTLFSDPALVKRTLEMTLSEAVRPQDVPQALGGLLSNPDGHDVAWPLVRDRWNELQKKVGPFLGGPAMVGALGTFCSAEKASEIRTFFEAHPVPEAQRTLQQALERIEVCAAVRKAQAPVLAKWLERM